MNAPQCTPRRPITQPAWVPPLCLFELRVSLDKLLRAASGEAHGYAAVFVVALDANYGSDAETRMTNFASQHGIGVAAAFCSRAMEGTPSRLAARSRCCLLRSAAHPAQEFFRGIRILGVRLVAACLSNLRHGSADRVHQFAWNFREKTRRQGSPQQLLIAEDSPVHGARQGKRLPRPCHSDVNKTTFLFDSFFFGNGPAVRANALFHAREEHVIEFQALSAMQGDECHAGLAFKLIRVAHQCGRIQKISEGLSRFHSFSEGTSKLFEVFQARDVLRSVAVLKHGHVAGFLKNRMQKSGWFLSGKSILQFADEFLKSPQRSYSAPR